MLHQSSANYNSILYSEQDGYKLQNIKLTLAYDGSNYHGWQRQKNAITIQEKIEEKIQIMANEPVKLIASGRTDSGVHALSQVCNFMTNSRLHPDIFKRGLNSLLPDDIFIKDATNVPLGFHSRYDAKCKIYNYRILNRSNPKIFQRNYIWHIKLPLDIELMKKNLQMIVGRHDFSSFRSSGSNNKNPVRTIYQAQLIEPTDEGLLHFSFAAEGFLKHMVRNIVGTVVQVGLKKITLSKFNDILKSRDRRMAGIKAPPQGLFLKEVQYD